MIFPLSATPDLLERQEHTAPEAPLLFLQQLTLNSKIAYNATYIEVWGIEMDLLEAVHGVPMFLWLILAGVAFFYFCACFVEHYESKDEE